VSTPIGPQAPDHPPLPDPHHPRGHSQRRRTTRPSTTSVPDWPITKPCCAGNDPPPGGHRAAWVHSGVVSAMNSSPKPVATPVAAAPVAAELASSRADVPDAAPTADEPHAGGASGRLNWLRAGVLGANDGIVSTASLVLGVSGATTARSSVVVAAAVGMLAGALSMAAGEYVSVSTQRDSERALIEKERQELAETPEQETEELAAMYRQRGLDEPTSRVVAQQLMAHDALRAHLEVELKIDPDELTNPWPAAFASMVSFLIGAAVPLVAVLLSPRSWVTVIAVAFALAVTGALSARLGGARQAPAVARNVGGGLLAMGITYGLGLLVGHVI